MTACNHSWLAAEQGGAFLHVRGALDRRIHIVGPGFSCYGRRMHPLPPDIAARIQQKVDAHLYTSPDDVLRHALDALENWQTYERREVLAGVNQAEQGDVAPLNMAEIMREAREQWDEQHP